MVHYHVEIYRCMLISSDCKQVKNTRHEESSDILLQPVTDQYISVIIDCLIFIYHAIQP